MSRHALPLALVPLALVALGLAGCRSYPPLATVPSVDLGRFAGDWYVIAHIPASLEKDAYNAVETYAPPEDGVVETTFTFREGGFDGPEKTYTPRGYVRDDGTNATWGMRFFWWWPFRFEYRVILLDDDYTRTVIGRTKRDYVWVMARTPSIPPAELEELLRFVEEQGYDRSEVRIVPQRWPGKSEASAESTGRATRDGAMGV